MQRSAPFSRSLAMMTALAAAMAMAPMQQQMALAAIGNYESRGKGGKRPHRHVGVAASRRAALKARNVRRNRAAHR